ncbi:winged helix-turn-helix transcriptional regulator [Pseudooceanicola sp. C21-150M6]|uniref:winged helix-turn-helix transcriptional regulator n=1 Tax=Pseudooceanicola sp. C21-150M6 TaxID=3434355 RepID=UPI003D7FEC5B
MDSNALRSISYDVFRKTCASHTVLEMLAGKWTYLIVCALLPGRLRNSELAKKIEGISPKMLSQTLRELERDGLLTRTVHPEVPPRVEYELTPLGEELGRLMRTICSWAEAHVPDILEARIANGVAVDQCLQPGRLGR